MGATPSQNHPWRQYGNRKSTKENGNGRSTTTNQPLIVFLKAIIENWNTMDLPVKYRGRFDRYSFVELPDKILSAWLISMLRRYNGYQEDVEEEIINETRIRKER